MGNLLGAPVTEKETHEGATPDGIAFAVSSMQGWRVHMEDAHIAERRMYAAELEESAYKKIDLPGHSLFAVFDGHGGAFAAMYSGRNLCRVLSRQPKFVEYAKFEQERPSKVASINSPEEKQQYLRSGQEMLEKALSDAFVELDREIAKALKGAKVADADQPYHDDEPVNGGAQAMQGVTAEGNSDGNANSNNPAATNPADAALRLLEEEGDSGTTACVVLITPQYVICANAGDSRAVISRLGNKAVPLSYDHKPDNEEEERRIRAAGGYVAGGRVEGDLAVSRGLGDYRFKIMEVVMNAPNSAATPEVNTNHPDDEPNTTTVAAPRTTIQPGEQKVSPIPDILVQTRNATQDEFIIIACDGIWDVQTNYEAVQTVAKLFKEGEGNLGLVCEEVCDICLGMGSKDNMTALVVKFGAQKVGDGGGVRARRQLRDADQEAAKGGAASGDASAYSAL